MNRRTMLLTGAAGGMGRACARLLGATHDLLLTDVSAAALDAFAGELTAEGYAVIGARAGDLGDAALLGTLAEEVAGRNGPLTLVHTAGLSPSLADARAIMTVNLVATTALLDALEPVLRPGSTAVLIASTAGHVLPPVPDVQALTDAPLAAGFLDAIGALIEGMAGGERSAAAGLAYCFSKQAVLRMVEQRAGRWGRAGGRIVSISPGLILTPMGRSELAGTPGAAQVRDSAPAGRPGRAIDIALAVQFLASDAAAFITGTDMRIDGGSVAAMRFP